MLYMSLYWLMTIQFRSLACACEVICGSRLVPHLQRFSNNPSPESNYLFNILKAPHILPFWLHTVPNPFFWISSD